MIEHLEKLGKWLEHKGSVVVARVIKTWGSAPQPVGAFMLIGTDGKLLGSVSGGCVEGEVVRRSMDPGFNGTLKLDFHASNEEAWDVGLACGGAISILINKIHPEDLVWRGLIRRVLNNEPCILVSGLNNETSCLITESEVLGNPISETVTSAARKALDCRTHQIISDGELDYFIQIFPRKPTLLIIGAAHVASYLVSLGNEFEFETAVIDPRGFFTENSTFKNDPDILKTAYPSEVLNEFRLDNYTYAVILSHDPKIDDDALKILLNSEVGYIGAMGSRKITKERRERFLARGYAEADVDRIHAPIGVDIKAKSAKEIALSIMGEIVRVKNEFK